jgi:hypothetical protein
MSSKANRIPYRLCLISDQLLFTAISLDMSPSKLFLHTNNFKIVTMSDVIKNLQSHSSEPQLHSSHQNITDEDDWKDWEDEDVVDSESSDIALKGSQSEIVGVVGTSDPLQETHNMLMAWENMVAVGSSEEMMQGLESAFDADLGDVDLSGLLEFEEPQPDDIALFQPYGDLEWVGGLENEPSGLGISMNNELPLPLSVNNQLPLLFPALATTPSPPSGFQIPGLDHYNQSHSNPPQPDNTTDAILHDDFPPSAKANMSSSDFFEQYKEARDDDIDLLEGHFIKTEVYITNAEWCLKDIKPYQKYRAKHPSRLRTCWTVIEGKEGANEDGLSAGDLKDW